MIFHIEGRSNSLTNLVMTKRSSTLNFLYFVDENNPPKSESILLRRRHRKDLSMSEYVQLKLRDLSDKPWEEVLRSPLVRNYLLLIGFLLMFLVSLFGFAVFKQYQSLRKNNVFSEIQY